MIGHKNYKKEKLVVLVQPDSFWRGLNSSYLVGMGLEVESYQHEREAIDDLLISGPILGINHEDFSNNALLLIANQGPEAKQLVEKLEGHPILEKGYMVMDDHPSELNISEWPEGLVNVLNIGERPTPLINHIREYFGNKPLSKNYD